MTMQDTLLVELLTEELPPKALARLGEAFAAAIVRGLADRKLIHGAPDFHWYASPRRLAVTVAAVTDQADDAVVAEKIMPVAVALDAAGNPSPALVKKLEAKGIPVTELAKFERRMDGKSETFFYHATVRGAQLDAVLAGIVLEAVKKLPIPKVMRWGDAEHEFVRPVHGLVQLHGARVVPGEVLGLAAGNATRGHRFMGEGRVVIEHAIDYARTLFERGMVVASFEARRHMIAELLKRRVAELGGGLSYIEDEALLDEVTALVEHPSVYVAAFEPEYLAVPQECLILTMKANQKYFPLLDTHGKLVNKFLVVSNMHVADPVNIVEGNARVVRPRLADAKFFFDQDRKQPLESRLTRLANVVYHNKLGSQLARVERLEKLAGAVAAKLHTDAAQAARAARLAKADLVTDMVGEFPELQGIMGTYYARHDGEAPAVAEAIAQHYYPRFAGDALPQGNVACAAALADKLDALVGFFGIGLIPSGDKDPFALRRAALGVLRILLETPLPLDLAELVGAARHGFAAGVLSADFEAGLHDFLLERLRNLLRDAGHAQDAVEAVLAQRPTRIDLVPAKLDAVRAFGALPEAQALAAANKRIVNILKKSEGAAAEVDVALLQEAAEKALFHEVNDLAPAIHSQLAAEDYTGALVALAGLRGAVDTFFDQVMVNTDEPLIRANRLALLSQLAGLMNGVADISRLAVDK
jgi:glycyl-tRNA synthetase beta chain